MIGVAIIGAGAIALANHLPGFALCPQAKVLALCDANPAALERAKQQTGITRTYARYEDVMADEQVNALVVATPNFLHAPIVKAAAAARKHVLCEKPIALNLQQALEMVQACESAGVRHMTAFTYRFVPAMRYMAHLVKSGDIGRPYHFRANRFQDWGDRGLGWRQSMEAAGSGELGDMLSHRIDYGHLLIGPMSRLVARTKRFIDVRGGQPSDVDDWVAVIADFKAGVTGVLESTKLATGRGEGRHGQDLCEVNGSNGTLVYSLARPLQLLMGRPGDPDLHAVPVPREFLTWPGSPRDPSQGDPLVTFRYDQDVEFVNAILEHRPCVPSLLDGARAQAVMDTIQRSDAERAWLDVPAVG